jgi:membrane dipeptidase
MPYIIDAHQDIAYNALSFGRSYLQSAADTRVLEKDTPIPGQTGQCLCGWTDYQKGQIALIIATLFIAPKRHQGGPWENQVYRNPEEAGQMLRGQIDYYRRLADENPNQFRLVMNRKDLDAVLAPWQESAAEPPTRTHPVGLVLSLEGAEGIRAAEELEEFREMGLHFIGPVWAGGRFCGGSFEPGGFTPEGYHLLEVMADLRYVLDLAHMNEESANQALDAFSGTVIASHANARALIKNAPNERHLSDRVIRALAERGGVMGVLPYNRFLKVDWTNQDSRQDIPLATLVNHIDHVCQLTGSVRHIAIGTDFDGGFGWPAVPFEVDTIADLQKIEGILRQRGYTGPDISAIFHGNWQRILETAFA